MKLTMTYLTLSKKDFETLHFDVCLQYNIDDRIDDVDFSLRKTQYTTYLFVLKNTDIIKQFIYESTPFSYDEPDRCDGKFVEGSKSYNRVIDIMRKYK